MIKLKLPEKIGSTITRAGIGIKKHAPEILLGTGIVGVVASAVLACRATLHLPDVLQDTKESLDVIHKKSVTDNTKKEITGVYVRTGLQLAKLYLPSVGLGAASIASILTSNGIMQKRNASLVAAYALIDTSFREYRARVVERFGEDVDQELRYDIRSVSVGETEVDENGKTKKVKKTIQVSNGLSGYAVYYDHETSKAWEMDRDYNLFFLRGQQALANNLLSANGCLFLNDVYQMIGIKRSAIGQEVGWVFDEENPVGQNFVDFRIKETHRKCGDGYEPVIVLDFNVQGPIKARAVAKNLITE